MTKEKQDQLYTKYPILYRQKDLSMQESCMYWGLACGDGWYDIIDTMSKNLSQYSASKGIVLECHQVKEKFGLLRVYLNTYDDNIDSILREAEKASAHTCEVCGKPGKMNKGSWLSVRCNEHRRKT